MSDHNEYIPADDEPALSWEEAAETDTEDLDIALPRKKGFTKTAWVIIVALVGLLIARSHWQPDEVDDAPEQMHVQELVFEIQARYLIGVANNGVIPVPRQDLYRDAHSL